MGRWTGILAVFVLVAACTAVGPSSPTETVGRPADSVPISTAEPATAYPAPRLTATAESAARIATAASTGRDSPIAATDMVEFYSPVLGLAFSYPSVLGDVDLRFVPGDTGYSYNGSFSRFDALTFEGRSRSFSQGRGRVVEDNLGFANGADGRYYLLGDPHDFGTPIVVDEVLEVNGQEVLVLSPGFTGSDSGDIYGPGALVNLLGEQFPGLMIVDADETRLPYDSFLAILHSTRVSTPEKEP